jgi:hypothetical protein
MLPCGVPHSNLARPIFRQERIGPKLACHLRFFASGGPHKLRTRKSTVSGCSAASCPDRNFYPEGQKRHMEG